MKKPSKSAKPSKPKPNPKAKAKTPAKKATGRVDPGFDVLKNIEYLAELFGPEDPVELFAEYLELCAQNDADDEEKNEIVPDLIEEFSELKINSNGGDPVAREKIKAIYDLLDNALEGRTLGAIDLVMMGKILADSGWDVPETLKQAVAETLQSAPRHSEGGDGKALLASLSEVAEQASQNPFDIYEYLSSILAGFPSEFGVAAMLELAGAKKPLIDQAVAGFVLHPDEALAQGAIEALGESAKRTAVESLLIERLVRIRPWLPPTRQARLDATIRAGRLNAQPPVKLELPKIITCSVSVCDGSGTRSLFATQRVGTRYQIATVMMKVQGVAEAMVIRGLSKSDLDDIVRQMKSSMREVETDMVGITRMLELAVADNFACGTLPPFKLVEVAETLGLGPINPDRSSPSEIIAGLVADLPPEQTNTAAVAAAHASIAKGEFAYNWFEAGEAVENLLFPVKGSKQRVAMLLKTYLPERRLFWARQCALSALAMRSDARMSSSSWKQLALVARDIASDLPLEQIPLMKSVAELSVRVFEGRP